MYLKLNIQNLINKKSNLYIPFLTKLEIKFYKNNFLVTCSIIRW